MIYIVQGRFLRVSVSFLYLQVTKYNKKKKEERKKAMLTYLSRRKICLKVTESFVELLVRMGKQAQTLSSQNQFQNSNDFVFG